MPLPPLNDLLAAKLRERDAAHQLRARKIIESIDPVRLTVDGVEYINFASNNYLGLTHHPRILEAIQSSLRSGAGSGAAGLITGYSAVHASAERAIATWKGSESAVLLPSGHQANLAAVQTLAASVERSDGIRFLLDKLAHASLIDAVRASGAEMRVFPHNGMDKLRRLLGDAPADQLQAVVTESIFSMDGDAADLPALAELKAEFPFVLLLDEAHGSGVFGPAGRGYAAEVGLQSIVDVTVVTLSKAVGCIGGAVCASDVFCQSLLNFGRAYIFSTSIPPFVAAAAEAAVDVMRGEPQRQERVRSLARQLRSLLGLEATAGPNVPVDSPIIPVILGEEEKALASADRLRAQGFWVTAVRPPTVPRGQSRLRITVSAAHSEAQVDALANAVRSLM